MNENKQMQNIDIKKILLYLTTLCVIANSACMWEYTTTSPFYGAKFGVVFLMLCVAQIILNGKISMCRNSATAVTAICVAFLIYGLVTNYDTEVFVTTYVLLFLVLFFYASSLHATKQLRQLFEAYSNIIVIISIISLFFWVFGSLLSIIPGKALQYYWADSYKLTYSWFGLYYENPIQNIGQPIVRNMGIFTEAPGFSGQIIYAMLIELAFIFENRQNRYLHVLTCDKRFFRTILLSLTMVSTLSTKGLIALMLMWVFVFLYLRCQTETQLALKVGTISIGAFAALVISNKLIAKKLGTGSGVVRMDDMSAAIKVWLEHPFFGVGYMNSEPIYQYQNVVRNNGGLSMGLVVLLAMGGICFFTIYFIAAIRVRNTSFFRKSRLTWLMVVTVLTYNLFVSNCGFSKAYIFLVAAAYAVPTEIYPFHRVQTNREIGWINQI